MVGCLLAWNLWHINLCQLFNAKFIFIQKQFYFKQFSLAWVHSLSKTSLFQAIQFTQTVLIQPIQFIISIDFVYTQLNVQTIQFSISTFQCQNLFPFKQFSWAYVTWYPTETIEIRLILSSRWNEQWQPVKKVTVKKECRSQRGYQQVLVLSNLRSPDTGSEKEKGP